MTKNGPAKMSPKSRMLLLLLVNVNDMLCLGIHVNNIVLSAAETIAMLFIHFDMQST